jgi:hypothetical protein
MKSGSGCPDPCGPPSDERGGTHEGDKPKGDKRGPGLRDVESTSIAHSYNHLLYTIADYHTSLVLGLEVSQFHVIPCPSRARQLTQAWAENRECGQPDTRWNFASPCRSVLSGRAVAPSRDGPAPYRPSIAA